MAKRVLLTNTIEPENAGFEQNLCVITINPEQAKALLGRIRLVNELKKKDTNLYSMEYWSGSNEYVVDRKLADVVLSFHEGEEPNVVEESRRIAGLIRAGVPLGQQIMPIEDPEGVIVDAMEVYDEEADGADDDTRFDCYTVVVDDDSVQYTALAKYGTGEGIKTAHIRVPHLRWLAGEDVELDEKVEAPR